tara:strand:- start:467 stop:601 length:135 start_codon:yes stop_codon:yes gene_type:complete
MDQNQYVEAQIPGLKMTKARTANYTKNNSLPIKPGKQAISSIKN